MKFEPPFLAGAIPTAFKPSPKNVRYIHEAKTRGSWYVAQPLPPEKK